MRFFSRNVRNVLVECLMRKFPYGSVEGIMGVLDYRWVRIYWNSDAPLAVNSVAEGDEGTIYCRHGFSCEEVIESCLNW
ncbi:hypothetical protein RJT34_15531 [Clitoria ternatea]|uniref:Uncharacterized protein n=1 Tax=Clitoria ternatea TaxID=43366 RepID=A0AAN9J5L3_CLITE